MHPAPHPFLYQLVGTWGQFLFPLPWRAFRIWYDMRRHNASREPVLGGLKTTQWWHNKVREALLPLLGLYCPVHSLYCAVFLLQWTALLQPCSVHVSAVLAELMPPRGGTMRQAERGLA